MFDEFVSNTCTVVPFLDIMRVAMREGLTRVNRGLRELCLRGIKFRTWGPTTECAKLISRLGRLEDLELPLCDFALRIAIAPPGPRARGIITEVGELRVACARGLRSLLHRRASPASPVHGWRGRDGAAIEVAELLAVIRVLEEEPARRVEVRSDSQYVVDGVRNREPRLARGAAHRKMWRRLDDLLRARAENAEFRITKVKAM